MLEKATDLFRTDPKIESLTSQLRFRAVNRYFVNTEGTVTRKGYTVYFMNLSGATQADDGMRLERSPYYSTGSLKELPTAEAFQADAVKMVDNSESASRSSHGGRGVSRPGAVLERCGERRVLRDDWRERAGQKAEAGRFVAHGRRVCVELQEPRAAEHAYP